MKFIVDEMLGRLVVWLRLLGYDTTYIKNVSDNVLVSQALKEKGIILTRDTRLIERKYIPKVLLVKSDEYMSQLKQIINDLELNPDPDLFFTRCLVCNNKTVVVSRERVENRVPDYVYKTHDKFFHCENCNKIYWHGTHVDNAKKKLEEINIKL